MRLRSALALLVVISFATPGAAQQSSPNGWQTWTWNGSCYAVLFPEDPGIDALKSKEAYAAVRHIPSENTTNSISFVSGMDQAGIEGVAEIDGKPFSLLVFKGAGFVSSGERENALLAAMQAGKELVVRWTTADSMIEQKYTLAGLDQAKRTIDMGCLGASTAAAPAN